MTAQPAGETDARRHPAVTPIDPDSPRGRWATEQLARNHAAVLARLEREGIPIPAVPTSEDGARRPPPRTRRGRRRTSNVPT